MFPPVAALLPAGSIPRSLRSCPPGRSPGRCAPARRVDPPVAALLPAGPRLISVVLFFEIMLVAAVVIITWFALYAVYRLITDDL